MPPTVVAVSLSSRHTFSKQAQLSIQLVAGIGVEGDAHAGQTVQHVYHKRKDPTRPNLSQVHLLHSELLAELQRKGFHIAPGQLGENITTNGLDVLGLPTGTLMHIGPTAVVQVTGLRNPCVQMDRLQPGLMAATLGRDSSGKLMRKAGIMSVVLESGPVHPGDCIGVELPPAPHIRLKPI